MDTSKWPTKSEVCTILNVSLSRVNDLVKARRLQIHIENRTGRPPIGRVNPDDVEREKQLRAPREIEPHVMPDSAIVPASGNSRAIVRVVEPLRFAFLNQHPPLWLRYDQAVAYTGLGESRLRELVERGDIRTERGPRGAVVLSRADLETHAERG